MFNVYILKKDFFQAGQYIFIWKLISLLYYMLHCSLFTEEELLKGYVKKVQRGKSIPLSILLQLLKERNTSAIQYILYTVQYSVQCTLYSRGRERGEYYTV